MTQVKNLLHLISILEIHRDFNFFREDFKPINDIHKIKYPLAYIIKSNVYKRVT